MKTSPFFPSPLLSYSRSLLANGACRSQRWNRTWWKGKMRARARKNYYARSIGKQHVKVIFSFSSVIAIKPLLRWILLENSSGRKQRLMFNAQLTTKNNNSLVLFRSDLIDRERWRRRGEITKWLNPINNNVLYLYDWSDWTSRRKHRLNTRVFLVITSCSIEFVFSWCL